MQLCIKAGVNFLREIGAAVGGLVIFPNVIAAHPSLSCHKRCRIDRICEIKSGQDSHGVLWHGATSHLAGELFK